ncbi:Uncharacterised protein [Mycobacterium tuberculosis]|uniref:Uncharacterized protein n=1 Tax=Mycobacterium tuberculosis TaxID=1773 RepID=A0A0T9E4W5_MYCTX|nr:Uncharacterised protein [Mycobacterium tuberculosis]CKS86576.1 Uncharacterised protein [Mycobacterium tuberculosis]COU96910.1 Uncharacterised protein [Mycobacterium tuberculosis]COV44269.1 Uncharacterised protein [Mycobacterium tuberculosis]COV76421.1 Uncharacterised protein [Mycobacterium tuberculosis]
MVAAANSAERSAQPRLKSGSLRSLRAISNLVASQSNWSGAASMSRITPMRPSRDATAAIRSVSSRASAKNSASLSRKW